MEEPKFKKSTILDFRFIILKSRREGFTLLEVMIALAIVGGLLVTLIYTLNYNLDIASRHEIITTATMLAKDMIADVETGGKSIDIEGKFPEPYEDYHYKVDIKDSKYPGVSEIAVTVDRDKERVKLTKLVRKAK